MKPGNLPSGEVPIPAGDTPWEMGAARPCRVVPASKEAGFLLLHEGVGGIGIVGRRRQRAPGIP